jgi:iron complex outermembrane recepter protein
MKFPLLIFLVLGFHIIVSQNKIEKHIDCDCFIQGKVLDEITKMPIVGAVVLIKELNKGIETDKNGFYKIDNICEGKYTVSSRIIGYTPKDYLINLRHGAEQNFRLAESEIHLANVDIKAQKIENLTQSKFILSDQNLDQTRGHSLGEALKQISGVTTLQTGSSIVKPVIHGMHSNRVLIMNNDLRQEGQQWGNEHAPEVDPFVAKKITIIKGAAGVRYGADAIAGIISLDPEPLPDTNKIAGEWNNIYFSNGRQIVSSGIIEGGQKLINKNKPASFGFRAQGTFKKGGDISTPDYNLANTGVNEVNYSLAINYKRQRFVTELYFSQFNTKIGVFAGSHIGNTADLEATINRGKPLDIYTPNQFNYLIDRPYQNVKHSLLKWKNVFNTQKGKISTTFGKQFDNRVEIDVLRGSKNLSQTFWLDTYNFESLWEHQPINSLFTGSVGINGIFQQNLTTGVLRKPVSSTVLIPNFSNLNYGIFVIERIVKEKWELEAGTRFDLRDLTVYRIPRGSQNSIVNQWNNRNFTGTIGFNYRPNTKLNFAANLSSAVRAPQVNELYSDGVHHGAASFELGDENLRQEKALNTSFTVNYIAKKYQGELQVYNNTINDFIFLAPTGRLALTIRGAFPAFRYSQTKALFQGFDFTNNFSLGKGLSFISKLSFLQASDKSNNQPLFQIPANRIDNSLKFEKASFFIALSNLYVAKQNRVPTKIIFEGESENEIAFSKYGGDFTAPPPAYNIWNFSIGNTFKIHRNILAISLTASNLTNNEYRDYLNRFRYFTDEMGRNIAIRTKLNF